MKRNEAFELIDSAVKRITGGFPTARDLPDSVVLCDGLDNIEGMDKDDSQAFAEAFFVASEMLEEEGFPI
jgi:hypothetical protein